MNVTVKTTVLVPSPRLCTAPAVTATSVALLAERCVDETVMKEDDGEERRREVSGETATAISVTETTKFWDDTSCHSVFDTSDNGVTASEVTSTPDVYVKFASLMMNAADADAAAAAARKNRRAAMLWEREGGEGGGGKAEGRC